MKILALSTFQSIILTIDLDFFGNFVIICIIKIAKIIIEKAIIL